MVYQHGSPFFDEDEESCRAMHRKAFRAFPHQPGLPGPHSYSPRRVLVVRLCLEDFSPVEGSQ